MNQTRRTEMAELTSKLTDESGLDADDINGRLLKQRIVLLWGDVTERQARRVVTQLVYLTGTQPSKPVTLFISSNGGSVSDCLAMYDAMQSVPAGVTTVCWGKAYSAGAFLLASGGAKGRRLIMPNAEVMIHQISDSMSDNVPNLELYMAQLKRLQDRMTAIMARHTGQPTRIIAQDTERDRWFFAEEAVAYGLADKVIKPGIVFFLDDVRPRRRQKRKAAAPAKK